MEVPDGAVVVAEVVEDADAGFPAAVLPLGSEDAKVVPVAAEAKLPDAAVVDAAEAEVGLLETAVADAASAVSSGMDAEAAPTPLDGRAEFAVRPSVASVLAAAVPEAEVDPPADRAPATAKLDDWSSESPGVSV